MTVNLNDARTEPITGLEYPLLDGHTDTLLALRDAADPVRDFVEGGADGHVDLPRAAEAGYGGGFFAMFVPNQDRDYEIVETESGYEVPYADRVSRERALSVTVEMLSLLYRLEASTPRFEVAGTLEAVESGLDSETVVAIPHLEGAAAVHPDLSNLDFLYAAGVRSIGLTWSRPNAFGEGVPFVYPSTPDTGEGLTEAGNALIDACEDRGILVDLAHLNSAGFWDVAARSTAPLVVTHAGVHEISPTSRNLTDDQLDAIADSGGVVGIQFGVENLRPDGQQITDTPISVIVDHVEYVADRVGVEHVAIGSDFDGCTVPDAVADVRGLPRVLSALRDRGFSDGELEAIATENWLRVLTETW
jgi:membrane dipeptidase